MARTVTRRTWTCRLCGHVNPRTRSETCQECYGRTKPKPRRTHRDILKGDTYPLFVKAAEEIHAVTDESCCVCGKPPKPGKRHDRDHDHRTGLPRGLACPGNNGCNMLMLPWMTADIAQAIADATNDLVFGQRMQQCAAYLRRVERHYAALNGAADTSRIAT